MASNSKWRILSIKQSTQEFFAEGRKAEDVTLFDILHGYIYARWPYLYIGTGLGESRLAKVVWPVIRFLRKLVRRRPLSSPNPFSPRPGEGSGVDSPSLVGKGSGVRSGQEGRWSMASGTHADGYHGKVVPLDSARRLVTVKENITLPDLEQVIPYPRARALILKNPEHIAVLECPCRAVRPNPCLPLEVCLIVGEPFAAFVVEHHPKKARRINQDEAVRILEETDARGNVHHAFFKEAMLGRFYAICNCCDCCCGAMQSQRHGAPMLCSSGYVCRVDDLLCIGCDACVERCQFHAIRVLNGCSVVDEAACMGCGVCVNGCEQGALELVRDERKGIPLEVRIV